MLELQRRHLFVRLRNNHLSGVLLLQRRHVFAIRRPVDVRRVYPFSELLRVGQLHSLQPVRDVLSWQIRQHSVQHHRQRDVRAVSCRNVWNPVVGLRAMPSQHVQRGAWGGYVPGLSRQHVVCGAVDCMHAQSRILLQHDHLFLHHMLTTIMLQPHAVRPLLRERRGRVLRERHLLRRRRVVRVPGVSRGYLWVW